MATISSVGIRQNFSLIKKAFASKGRAPVTTASDLKLVLELKSNKTAYTFPVLIGDDTSNFPESILLNRADSYTATEMGLFIGAKNTVNDTAYDIFSYPNTVEFGQDADTLKTIFNAATIDVTINNVQYLQNFSCARFRTVGQTQYTQMGNPATQDQFDATFGYYPIIPTLQLSGTAKVNITLNLPQALNLSGSNQLLVVMINLRGFLSLGASNLNK
jgi:hypothetical protein